MKLKSLRIQNFMSIENVALSLEDRGLVLVLGDNRDSKSADSNGAAKTAVLDALCWCLWGETTRKVSADDVVNRFEGKNCEVELHGEVGGTSYRIIRYRKSKTNAKPNDLRVFVGDQELTGATMALTQERVTRLVGLDYQTFAAMMPGSGLKATELTDTEIKLLLEAILQTEHFSAAYDLARKEATELEKRIKDADALIASDEKTIEAIEARLSLLLDAKSKFETKKAAETMSIRIELERNQAKLKDVTGKMGNPTAIKAKIEQWSLKRDEAVKELEGLRTTLRDAERNLDKLDVALAEAVAPLRAKQKQYDAVIQKAKKLGTDCPSCFQEVSGEHKEKVLANAQTMVERMEQSILSEQNKYAADAEFVRKGIESTKDSMAKATSRLNDANEGLRIEERLLKEHEVAEAEKTSVKSAIAAIEKTLAEVRSRVYDSDSLIEELRRTAEERTVSVAASMKSRATLQDQFKTVSFWKKAFSPSGIRSFVLGQVAPVLNDRARYYSDILTGGEMKVEFSTTSETKKGEEKESFEVKVSLDKGSSTYEGCSAGEKARADLIVALSLGDLAAMRSKHGLEFRFIDEAFEKMDTTGVEAVVRLLKRQEQEYRSVFVVTHKKELQDHFDKSITMVKQNGRTTLMES